MIKILVSVFLVSLAFVSCKTKPEPTVEKVKIEVPESREDKLIGKGYTQGTIIDKTGLSGCSFLIQTTDSVTYEPINLNEEFKKDGLAVFFKFRLSRKATTCMNGQTIFVSEMMK